MKEKINIPTTIANINKCALLFTEYEPQVSDERELRNLFLQDFATKLLDECVKQLKNNYSQDPNNLNLNLALLQIYIYQYEQVTKAKSQQYDKSNIQHFNRVYSKIIENNQPNFIKNFPIYEADQADRPFLFTRFKFNATSGSTYDYNPLELKQEYTNKINGLINKYESNNALINIDSNPLLKTLISWIKIKITSMSFFKEVEQEVTNGVDINLDKVNNVVAVKLSEESFDTEKLSNAIKIIYSSFKDYVTNLKLIKQTSYKDLLLFNTNSVLTKESYQLVRNFTIGALGKLQKALEDNLKSIKKNEELKAEEERIKLEEERITLEKKQKNEKKKEKRKEKKKQLKAEKKEDANLVKVEKNEEQKKEEKDANLVKEEEEEKQTDNEQINSQSDQINSQDDQINSQSEPIDSDDENITIQQEIENTIENLKSLTESIKNNFADEIAQEKELLGYKWGSIKSDESVYNKEHNCYFIATNKLLKELNNKGYKEEEFLNLWRTKHTDFNYVKNINSFKFKLYGKQGDYRCIANKIIKNANGKAKVYLFEQIKNHDEVKKIKAKNITEIKLDNKTFIDITKRFEQKDSNNNYNKLNEAPIYKEITTKEKKGNEFLKCSTQEAIEYDKLYGESSNNNTGYEVNQLKTPETFNGDQ